MSLPRATVALLLLLGSVASVALAAGPVNTALLPPFPSAGQILPGEGTPSPQLLADRILLPIVFTDSSDRVYWDIPLIARLPSQATSLEIEVACANPALVRGLSAHLQSGDGWHAFSSPLLPSATRQRVSLPQGLFKPEGQPGAWNKSKVLRLSAWKKNASGMTDLTLFAVSARTDTIALVRSTERTAPGETALASALADRQARLLSKAAIPFTVIDDSLEALSPFALVFLPYAPKLPGKQMSSLEHFVKKGGKLVVFYNATPALGSLLGVRVGAWQGTEPGHEWTALICDAALLPDAPPRVPHPTNSILPPFATGSYHARPIAFWADDTARPTDQPACVLSDRGAWFAHIPPLAYPSAAIFLRALTFALYADLPPLPAPAHVQPITLQPSEFRAAWASSSYARDPRGWKGFMPRLSKYGINALFVHLQSAGTAHYKTAGTREESNRIQHSRPSDPLAEARAAGRTNGIAVHAWATCWTLEGASEKQQAQLERENRLMCDATGKPLPWLCPSVPENRALIIGGLCDLVRRGVQGIHLDYVRYPEMSGCYAPATQRAFESKRKAPVTNWPSDVLPGGPAASEFQRFRCDTITSFVREARDAARAINPDILISAAVYPSPESALPCGQDWPAWVRAGLVDFVCPMIYTESDSAFAATLDACLAALPTPTALVPGIGTGTDESQLDAASAALQIGYARSRHVAGFAFFSADDELLTTILPCLFSP